MLAIPLHVSSPLTSVPLKRRRLFAALWLRFWAVNVQSLCWVRTRAEKWKVRWVTHETVVGRRIHFNWEMLSPFYHNWDRWGSKCFLAPSLLQTAQGLVSFWHLVLRQGHHHLVGRYGIGLWMFLWCIFIYFSPVKSLLSLPGERRLSQNYYHFPRLLSNRSCLRGYLKAISEKAFWM